MKSINEFSSKTFSAVELRNFRTGDGTHLVHYCSYCLHEALESIYKGESHYFCSNCRYGIEERELKLKVYLKENEVVELRGKIKDIREHADNRGIKDKMFEVELAKLKKKFGKE